MKKTGGYLVRYALEQLGIRHTFGIPGVHNTEIYDELNKSESIQPTLVTHECCGAFMADAISRTSDSVGALVIVPAAGASHAASGIGEAFLDGIPMLVISGGVRNDSQFEYQLHDMDQHAMLKPITKKTFKVATHADVVPTLFEAYRIATSGEPGPVFVEVPVNIQLDAGEVDGLAEYQSAPPPPEADPAAIERAVQLLSEAERPGLFLGWGAVDATEAAVAIAERLGAPVSTTLQGLSAFPANHPLHTGMSFGPAAVPAATKAFEGCDCLLAVGTRFAEIATGSFGVTVPKKLIHIDINPKVFSANYPAEVAIEGDSKVVLPQLARALESTASQPKRTERVSALIAEQKRAYRQEWANHDSKDRVNPSLFFEALRSRLNDDAIVVADDGNHTFLVAELLPIHGSRGAVSPTDYNCMGYAVPATIAAKLGNPDRQVVGIIGDGAFLMTCMELMTAAELGVGAVFTVFSDGELSQISQAQNIPYNRKTCTILPHVRLRHLAEASGAEYIRMQTNQDIDRATSAALSGAADGKPVILDVNVDYSKKTRFTKGIIGTNLKRMPLDTKARMIGRSIFRHATDWARD